MGSGGSTKKKSGKEVSSPDADAIVVWSYRALDSFDETLPKYDEKAKIYGDYMRERIPGVYNYTYAPHPDKPGFVCDVQWFNTIKDFRAHMFMTSPTGMKKMLDFTGMTSTKHHYTGYCFGAWEQKWYGPVQIPTMFGNMPPDNPAWFEFREQAAGFIKPGPASTHKPPIIIMSEWLAQDGEAEDIVHMWQEMADDLKKVDKVRACFLTRECLRFKLRDKGKTRNPNLLVALNAFEDLDTYMTALGKFKDQAGALKAKMELPLTAEIWAEDDEEGKLDKLKAGMNEFDEKGKYTFFSMNGRGWSDHSGKTGDYEEEKIADSDKDEHSDLCKKLCGYGPCDLEKAEE